MSGPAGWSTLGGGSSWAAPLVGVVGCRGYDISTVVATGLGGCGWRSGGTVSGPSRKELNTVHLLDESGQWRPDYLDQSVVPGAVRVHVLTQVALCRADQQFFVRPRDIRMVLAYARAFGPSRMLRKVRSRQAETVRNDAWLSVGIGRLGDVGETDIDGQAGDLVGFVATSAPRGVERLVLPEALVWKVSGPDDLDRRRVHYVSGVSLARDFGVEVSEVLSSLAGWQPETLVQPALDDATKTRIAKVVLSPPSSWMSTEEKSPESSVRERAEGGPVPGDRPSYHVFGYGQYAKVNAIANLDLKLHLAGIHEINPAQLGPVPATPGPALDTSPVPRADEKIENVVLAGYHHSHGPLAVELIERGARHVIIEKPLTTTEAQLDDLLAAMDRHPDARVHAAFQRRHSPFNRLIRRDLGSGPISMSATVYEVPLPALHWYRWPVVGNSVVSNGCHWIDYFLYLNDFPQVSEHRALVLADQVVLVLELSTGASCAISLRHVGSPRLGVRDLISLWHDDATVTIEDNSRYRSEQGFGRSRSASCSRLRSHEDMYVEFARRISEDSSGDSRRSIEISTRAMVRLAELVDEASPRSRESEALPSQFVGSR